MRRVQREFSCLMLVLLIEKDMRRTEQMFQGNLKPKRAKGCGYFESYEEWVNISKANYKDLESGPVKIDIQEGAAPVIDQLWPIGNKIMVQAYERMKPFLELARVSVTHLSPFCREFDSPKDLLQVYVEYCPRTFKYGSTHGTNEEVGEVEESVVAPPTEKVIAAGIRQLVKDIDELDNEGMTEAAAVDDPESEESEGSTPAVRSETGTDSVSHKVMDAVLALLNCDDCSKIFQLALVASAAIKSVNRKAERGSLEFDLKAHTLRGRWIDDKALKSKSVPLSSMSSVVYGIERHTIVSRAIKVGRGKASRMIAKTY